MPFESDYRDNVPSREEIDRGAVVLEFGASWCGHCIALTPSLEKIFELHADVRHIRVADGRGKALGRSFHVKLWPTFIFLRDGRELNRLVRPNLDEVRRAFHSFAGR